MTKRSYLTKRRLRPSLTAVLEPGLEPVLEQFLAKVSKTGKSGKCCRLYGIRFQKLFKPDKLTIIVNFSFLLISAHSVRSLLAQRRFLNYAKRDITAKTATFRALLAIQACLGPVICRTDALWPGRTVRISLPSRLIYPLRNGPESIPLSY